MDGQDEKGACFCAWVGLNVGLVLSSIRYNLSYLSHILICSVLLIFLRLTLRRSDLFVVVCVVFLYICIYAMVNSLNF